MTLENTVITGGFYLSTHTLYETLMGIIHTFILPSLLTEGDNLPLTIFARQIIHYRHNAYVMNDSSDREHLLSFSSMDDARDLFSLTTIAIFLNVLDERTYQFSSEAIENNAVIRQQCHVLFDLNAIPIVERYHLCYTRGLSFDLLGWFFENFSFSSIDFEEYDVEPLTTIFVPFLVHVGRQIVRYKRLAEKNGHSTSSTSRQVANQVQLALFGFKFTRDTWLEEKAIQEERDYNDKTDDDDLEHNDLDFDLTCYTICRCEQPTHRNSDPDGFLESGKTIADKRFFCGLTLQFDIDELGKFYIFKHPTWITNDFL